MHETKSEFEKSLDPNYQPPLDVGQEKDLTVKTMEVSQKIDHHSRPLTVSFRTRYHAIEAWSSMKKILETFQVDQQTAAAMMESMSSLASAIDMDVKAEIEELEEKIKASQEAPAPVQLNMPMEEVPHAGV